LITADKLEQAIDKLINDVPGRNKELSNILNLHQTILTGDNKNNQPGGHQRINLRALSEFHDLKPDLRKS
jgi:hypothetical protein